MGFKINDSKDLPHIHVTFSGRHADAELSAYQDAIFGSEGFLHRDQLIDYSAVDDYQITSDGLAAYTERAEARPETKDISEKRKLAFVGISDLVFGMGRVFVAKAHQLPGHYQMFRSIEEAKAWLADPRDPPAQKK
jgi:hypothetical protein